MVGLVGLVSGVAVPVAAAGQPAPTRLDGLPFAIDWMLQLGAAPAARPAVAAGLAFVPLRNGTLTAVSLARGEVAWSRELAVLQPPAAGGGMVFATTAETLSALDVEDGRTVWTVDLGAGPAAPPLWDAGWLAVGVETGDLLVLRAADGARLWRADLGAPLSARPAIGADRIYLPLRDGRVQARDLLSGGPVWERRLGGPGSEILPLDDRLFLGSADNFFYCLDVRDGRVRWRWRTGADMVGAPVVDERRVFFVAMDHLLRALDRSGGSQRWRVSLPARPMAGPLRVGSSVLAGSFGPTVMVFGAEDGRRLPGITAPGDLAVPVQIATDEAGDRAHYLAILGDGRFYAFRRGVLPQAPLQALPGVELPRDPGPPLPSSPLKPVGVIRMPER